MILPRTYARPTSLEQARRQLSDANAVALAGGALLFGRNDLPYEAVIDLQALLDLQQITVEADGVRIGAAASLQSVIDSEQVLLFLKRSLMRALPLNIRNGASVGESLLVDAPPREWLAALAACDATVSRMMPSGERTTDSLVKLFESGAASHLRESILTDVFVPNRQPHQTTGAAYVARTPADEPIVNAAVVVELDGQQRVSAASTILCGASAAPVVRVNLDTLIGHPFDEANIASAVKLVAAQVEPVSDYLGSADYRREMARVLTQRALLDALAALAS